VESLLGEGGMAKVYRIRHNQLGTLHALKVLTVQSAKIRSRLLLEGRVQARLRHRNIVNVTDVVSIGENPGLVMEYIQGPSLESLLSQENLNIDQVDTLVQGILSGVGAAHRQDLIHRDLKPANILLQIHQTELLPKVADFGLAKLLDEDQAGNHTRSGVAMGTPAYMSPEQVRDAKTTDRRTDIFSLGAILYEMLTGNKAFYGEDMLEIFNRIADAERTPIRELLPDLPERMEQAVQGALRIDRDKRIGSCEELLAIWTGQEITEEEQDLEATGPWSRDMLERATVKRMEEEKSLTLEPPQNSQPTWSASLEEVEVPDADPDTGMTTYPSSPTILPREMQQTGSRGWIVGLGLGVALAGGLMFLGRDTTTGVPSAPHRTAPHRSDQPVEAEIAQEVLVPEVIPPATAEPETPPTLTPQPTADPSPPIPSPSLEGLASPGAAPGPPVNTALTPAGPPPGTSWPVARTEALVIPRPATPPPGTAWVHLEGDATNLYLRSAVGDYRPGDDIPAGEYSQEVFFDGRDARTLGNITLVSGEQYTIRCNKALMLCQH
jgi:serine/threonine protein kinase